MLKGSTIMLCLRPQVGLLQTAIAILSAYEMLTICYLSYEDLAHAIDLDVIKQRSNVSSQDVNIHSDFYAQLLECDKYCVWSGVTPKYGSGMHIVPFERGSEVFLTLFFYTDMTSDVLLLQWLKLIIDSHPSYSEDMADIRDINDVQNGIFAAVAIHIAFDLCSLVVCLCLSTQFSLFHLSHHQYSDSQPYSLYH